MEEVLFENERTIPLEEVATYLRTVAERLETGDSITLDAGGQSVSLDPPDSVEFEVKAEREGPANGTGELSVEFELEWPEDASGGDGSLTIS